MILYLVRHAKSSWAERGLPDHDRPLNARGRSDAPRMFERLHSAATVPELIVSSDAVRAASTARLLHEAIQGRPEQIAFEAGLYHAGVEQITAIARALPDSAQTVALVGHNPGMTYTANELAENLDLDNLPTCGIVGIHFDIHRWAELTSGLLCYFDYPKNTDGPLIRNPADP